MSETVFERFSIKYMIYFRFHFEYFSCEIQATHFKSLESRQAGIEVQKCKTQLINHNDYAWCVLEIGMNRMHFRII